jgi:hypothetical protein
MKKIFLCLVAIVMCVNVNAFNPHRYRNHRDILDNPIGCNVGVCYYKHGQVGYCCGLEGMGMTFELACAGKYKVDNPYGNGGISDDYRMTSYIFGHIRYLQCRNSNVIFTINPKIGLCVESRLYNYRYCNTDVASNNIYLEGGLDIGMNINSVVFVKVGVTNMKLNTQIAIAF